MTKDVILKPSRRKEKTHFILPSGQFPARGPGALAPAELRRAGPRHSLTSGASSPQPQCSPPLCSAPPPVSSAPAACAAGT